MKKRLLAMLLVLAMALALCACGEKNSDADGEAGTTPGVTKTDDGGNKTKDKVVLTVWAGESDESQKFLKEAVEAFKTEYADRADFDIQIGAESESSVKDTVLADPEAAADVFYLADDQLADLVTAGAIQKIQIEADEAIEENGGQDAGAVKAASIDGTLYAYPATASNGYFMFYNKAYFTDSDVASLDKMMEVAAAAGKKISMQLDSGWYLYSFFQGAGLSLTLNGEGTNDCKWNATSGTYKGIDVANSLLAIASNPGFTAASDADFLTGIAEGTIIAGVNGTWNAKSAQNAWGEDYAAVKLPTYTVAGAQVQMASYAGYKLVAVSNYSEFAGYAMLLARWLTNYDNQIKRFDICAEGPSNVSAAGSDTVLKDPATAALAAQSQYATVQRVQDAFWTPAETFGTIIIQGNPDKLDLQKLLDDTVSAITTPPVE